MLTDKREGLSINGITAGAQQHTLVQVFTCIRLCKIHGGLLSFLMIIKNKEIITFVLRA